MFLIQNQAYGIDDIISELFPERWFLEEILQCAAHSVSISMTGSSIRVMSKDGDIIRRRRECSHCQRRFTTYERVEETLPLIIKKDGRREIFDRNKILAGLHRACEKRPISVEVLEKLVDRIEQRAPGNGGPRGPEPGDRRTDHAGTPAPR